MLATTRSTSLVGKNISAPSVGGADADVRGDDIARDGRRYPLVLGAGSWESSPAAAAPASASGVAGAPLAAGSGAASVAPVVGAGSEADCASAPGASGGGATRTAPVIPASSMKNL